MKDLAYLWVVLVLVKARITWRRKVVLQTVLKKKNGSRLQSYDRWKKNVMRDIQWHKMGSLAITSSHLFAALFPCELTTASLRDFWPYSAIPPQWAFPSRSSLVESTLLLFKACATKTALQSWWKHTLETSPKFFLLVLLCSVAHLYKTVSSYAILYPAFEMVLLLKFLTHPTLIVPLIPQPDSFFDSSRIPFYLR